MHMYIYIYIYIYIYASIIYIMYDLMRDICIGLPGLSRTRLRARISVRVCHLSMLGYAMLRYAMLRYAMLRYATLR